MAGRIKVQKLEPGVMKGRNEEGKPGNTEWRESGGKM